ncbi:MAG: bifunctional diaminohydroxyphosphoribosylaminopyrimidine deaminase/5-amino-6-(5-phosphoribosylamino)uracil reductase RibD [Pseudomonadota bacterium]
MISQHNDRRFMKFALTLAKRGLGQTSSNPSVGAVVVQLSDPPVIIGQGRTQNSGRPHAEVVALQQAGEKAKGATLYVTLEPCSHYGRSPPCVNAILASGIQKVVIGIEDPNPEVAGQGIQKLKDAGLEVCFIEQTLQQEAAWLTKGHVLRMTEQRPFVQVKLAVDKNAHIAPGQDQAPVWITGQQAREQGHKLRSQADAILIGRGTAQVDNPSLTCRLPGLTERSPIRVVLDHGLNVSADSQLFEDIQKVPLLFISAEDVSEHKKEILEKAGAEVINVIQSGVKKSVAITKSLQALTKRGITRIMLEGGPKVVRSFWDAGCIDELVIFQNPAYECASSQEAVDGLRLNDILQTTGVMALSMRQVGEDLMTTYRIMK